MIQNDGINGRIFPIKPNYPILMDEVRKKIRLSAAISDLTDPPKIRRDRKGTLAIEYAVIAALIAVPLVGSAPDYARKVQKTFAVVSRALQTACEASAGTNVCK